MDSEGPLRSLSHRKIAVNGRIRTRRNQAAAWGLALLMGASFYGCHSGPRLFTKKSHDDGRVAKKDDANKSKFINRKKARPESDYLREEELAERVAKSDSKSKPKPNSGDAQASEDLERAIAARPRGSGTVAAKPPSAKSSAETARRTARPQPTTDFLDDPLLDEASDAGNRVANSTHKPTATSKAQDINEDPFKNIRVNSPAKHRTSSGAVARVNYDNLSDAFDDLDEVEEAEEREETQEPRPRSNPTSSSRTVSKPVLPPQKNVAAAQRKFLPGDTDGLTSLDSEEALSPGRDEAELSSRSVSKTTRDAGSSQDDLRADQHQSAKVRQTIESWRREMEEDEVSLDESVGSKSSDAVSSRRSNAGPRLTGAGHISQTTLDEFLPTPPTSQSSPMPKSQGAVLNGELIIDTSNLPTRFQRSSPSASGSASSDFTEQANDGRRMRSNSAASIDIVPGATQNRSRSAGPISLQSHSDVDSHSSGIESAVFERTDSATNELGSLPPFTLSEDSSSNLESAVSTGPRFGGGKDKWQTEQISEDKEAALWNMKDDTAESVASPVWTKVGLVCGSVLAAILIGLGLRRRKELVPVLVRTKRPLPPHDPAHRPRG